MRYKIEKFIRRLKFVLGFYDSIMLLPYVFSQEAFEQSDASKQVYLGDIEMALRLLDKGIKHFYYRTPASDVASIGYDPDTKTWWGWSHRAINSYRVGDFVMPNHVGYEEACKQICNWSEVKDTKIKLYDEDECRKMAEIFAEDVS